MQEVRRYAETVRKEHYDALVKSHGEQKLLRELLDASELLDISWRRIPEESPLVGKTQAETLMRVHTGANVVAIMREGQLLLNPPMDTVFLADDRLGLLANAEQVEAVERMFLPGSEEG
jgi:CPA2 family monovalent cation:H+ antiporter-2